MEKRTPHTDNSHQVSIGWRLAFQTHSGKARGFLRFWPIWEWITNLYNPQIPIPGAPYDLLRVKFTRFHGRAITLADGTYIQSGDKVVVLHVHNALLVETLPRTHNWQLLHLIIGDLRALSQWMQRDDFPADVRAVFGYTLLGRGAPRLGFTVRERPQNIVTYLDRFFLMGLLVLYNPEGRNRLSQGTTYDSRPIEVWMSRGELQRRYGQDEQEIPENKQGIPKAHVS